jgi:hypothetical protein
MVDRGGLNYPIRVRDEFSKTTALFRKEIRASKKEFRAFQKAVKGNKSAAKDIRNQAKALQGQAKAQRALSAATKSGNKPLSDRERLAKKTHAANKKLSRSIDALAKKQRARERVAVALRNAQTADARREKARVKTLERQAAAEAKLAQSKNAGFQAQKRLNAAKFQEAIALKQIAILRKQAGSQLRGGDIRGGLETLRRSKAIEASLKGQLGTAKRLLFTFRRLVGALAIFTLARKGVQAFNALVKSGIQFNDTVATAQLGIAGLVVTLGDVRDAQGGAVSATEQLNLALGVARQQSARLRQDSLKTVATFEQLLDTFQVSVGPGLAAGLDLDEVRQLTVDISQAAGALGVPQNQLAEEVRSLLSGTIQARTTRIATALGISNEDVRQLKEAGTLFEVLEEKFAGFNDAAQRQARETFTGISTLIKGITQEILGQAAKPLFDELIGLGNRAFDAFLSVQDAAGNIRPNPEVVAAFQQVFDALKRSVQAIKELGQGSAIGALETTMATIAVTIDFVTGAVVAMVEAFTFVRDVIADVGEFLGVTSENAGFAAQAMGGFVVKALLALKAVKLINVSMIRTSLLIARWIAPFAVIIKALELVFSKVSGVNLGIKDTIEIIAVSLLGAWFDVAEAIDTVAAKITSAIIRALDFIITEAQAKARSARGFIAALFGDEGAEERAQVLNDAEKVLFNGRKAAREKEHKAALQDIKDQAEAKRKALEDELARTIGARAGANAQGEGFDPSFAPGAVPGTGGISGPPTAPGGGGAQVFGRARIDDDTLKRATEETVQLQAQAEAERAKTDAILRGAGTREMATVAARNALLLAEAELVALEKKNGLELEELTRQRAGLAEDGAELENLNEVIAALQVRQGFETEILRLRTEQLQKAQEEAELVANGSLTDGLREGFAAFSEEFSSNFNAGLQIAKESTMALASFISQSIVDAFDPTQDTSIVERFARFMQQIAGIILQQLLQVAIAKGIKELGLDTAKEASKTAAEVAGATAVGAVEITTATTIAGIRLANAQAIAALRAISGGFSQGGLVRGYAVGGSVEHATKAAQPFASGGPPKPSHIPASDTIPAWLTPGEFVLRKSAVNYFGIPLLQAMNGGNMPVVGSSSAEAAGPSKGMASGGRVADQNSGSNEDRGEGGVVVVPAVVATDREMDTLTAGGRNAMLSFMRENAGNINALLDGSGGKR